MVKKETKYIIRRVIVGVLIALILSFIRGCEVYAENCVNTNSWIGYYDSSNNYVSAQNTTTRTYNGFGKGVSFGNLNNNLKNNSFIYSAKFSVTYNEYVIMDSVPSLTITIKDSSYNSQDITSDCYISSKKICESYADGFCFHPNAFEYSIICSTKSNNANAREINVYSRFTDIEARNVNYTTTFERLLDCLVISPSDKEEIISNDDANTQEILDQNYTYYNSLLEYMNGFENRQSDFISEWGEILENSMTRNKNQIIANQNSNNQELIDSQKVCTHISKANIIEDNKYFNSQGNIADSEYIGITDYYKITGSTIKVVQTSTTGWTYLVFYDVNKNKISWISNSTLTLNQYITIPNNAVYVRFSIIKSQDVPQFDICTNGNQAISDTLTDSNIGNTGTSFFNNFNTGNWHGLQAIISLPLNYIQSLNNTCQPITLPTLRMFSFTFDLTIPCMSTYIYSSFPSDVINILRLLINGFLIYRLLRWAFEFIKELRDPDYDELEVMDL